MRGHVGRPTAADSGRHGDLDGRVGAPGGRARIGPEVRHLVQHGRLALLDLVEDELLLALPQVPRNPNLDAAQFQVSTSEKEASAPDKERVRQPFAGLAEQLAQREAGKQAGQEGSSKAPGKRRN